MPGVTGASGMSGSAALAGYARLANESDAHIVWKNEGAKKMGFFGRIVNYFSGGNVKTRVDFAQKVLANVGGVGGSILLKKLNFDPYSSKPLTGREVKQIFEEMQSRDVIQAEINDREIEEAFDRFSEKIVGKYGADLGGLVLDGFRWRSDASGKENIPNKSFSKMDEEVVVAMLEDKKIQSVARNYLNSKELLKESRVNIGLVMSGASSERTGLESTGPDGGDVDAVLGDYEIALHHTCLEFDRFNNFRNAFVNKKIKEFNELADASNVRRVPENGVSPGVSSPVIERKPYDDSAIVNSKSVASFLRLRSELAEEIAEITAYLKATTGDAADLVNNKNACASDALTANLIEYGLDVNKLLDAKKHSFDAVEGQLLAVLGLDK